MIAPMNKRRAGAGVAVLHGRLYAAGECDRYHSSMEQLVMFRSIPQSIRSGILGEILSFVVYKSQIEYYWGFQPKLNCVNTVNISF